MNVRNLGMLALALAILLVVITSFTVGMTPALAQSESTPEPGARSPVSDLETTPDTTPVDSVVIEADAPGADVGAAFAVILGFGSAVAFAMELLKGSVLKRVFAPESQTYATAAQVAALVLSLILVFGFNDARANLFTALGLFPDVPIFIAQLVTALAISQGNLFLTNVSDFFGKARTPTIRASSQPHR